MTVFEQWTSIKQLENGHWEISCNKGLWAVSASSKSQATLEAMNYFIQYLGDGEYSDMGRSE